MDLSKGLKTTLSVLTPELVAPAVTLGAVYCAGQYAPDQLKHVARIVSKYIVEPQLKFFELAGGSLKHARNKYDEAKRAEMIRRGEPVPEKNASALSRQERADIIAEVLTKGALAFGADYLATLGGQQLLAKKIFKMGLQKRTAIYESLIHLGGIGMMAVPFAKSGEDMHYGIKRFLEKHGVSEKRADDIGMTIPYIVLPGQIAALAMLMRTHIQNGKFPKSI